MLNSTDLIIREVILDKPGYFNQVKLISDIRLVIVDIFSKNLESCRL